MFTFKLLLHAAVLLGLMQVLDVSGKTFIEDLTLTASEKKTLDKFKDLVLSQVDLPQEYMKKDVYLIRWLRAQYYDIYEAKKMLEKNLKWRKELKMDSILSEDWSYYQKNFPTSLEGRDKEGKPILYVNIGAMDLRREVVGGQMNQMMRFVSKLFEEGCGLVRELGEKQGNVSQGILLLNAQGFSLVQHGCLQCIPAILNMVVIYENHYPGCADRIFLINVPNAAQPIIQGARRIIHRDTNEILEIYGTNRNIWINALTKQIPLSELPPELGGSKFYKGLDFDNLDYY